MLYRKIIGLFRDSYKTHKYTVCTERGIVNVKLVVHTVTTGIQSVLNPLNNTINLHYF